MELERPEGVCVQGKVMGYVQIHADKRNHLPHKSCQLEAVELLRDNGPDPIRQLRPLGLQSPHLP